MKSLSAKSRVALGQTGLLVSVLLSASFFGLVPDRITAVREGRAALAEVVAVNSSILVSENDVKRLEAELRLAVERNETLLSAGLRRADGRLLVEIEDHARQWEPNAQQHSTDSQVRVPIWAGQSEWGQVELRFEPLVPAGWLGMLQHPLVVLAAFMTVACFFVFYFYLGKMLKQLDPSQAVPSRVRSALDTMAEGLLVIDRKAQVVLANQAFAALLATDSESLLGRLATEFAWVDDDGEKPDEEHFPWLRTLETGVAERDVMIKLQVNESERRTFMVNCSPILAAGPKPGGVLVSFDDITDLEAKEVELRVSRDEAEAANRSKSEFLANMSHEIRTPMNAILGFTEVLKRGYGKDTNESQRHLNTIHSSGKHLLELINDILDLSKVEAGRMEVERQPCAAHLIIQETVKVLGVKAREQGITLEFVPDGELPETIHTDPSRLRQIVTNLIGNALKFTEEGGVTVTARVDESAEPVYVIDITDTGIGMEKDRLDRIFEAFVQADASTTRRFGGTGLGLSISKGFALALGGDIAVTSEPGKGSTFSVRLDAGPLEGVRRLRPEELPSIDDAVTVANEGAWEFPAARILVVDDGVENRELAALVLEEVGLRVDQAENGKEGLDMALAEGYDVILMDVQMPVMDGFEAATAMRAAGLETPVIALTANAMKGFDKECLAAGYTGFMTKPIDIDGLIGTLAELLGGRRASAPAAADDAGPVVGDVPVVEASEPGGPPIDSTLPTANPRVAKVVAHFIERLAGKLTEMDDAFAARNLVTLAELGHWLKGAGGTVGFGGFTEPAHALELAAKAADEDAAGKALHVVKGLAARLSTPGDAEAPPPAPKVAPPEAIPIHAPAAAAAASPVAPPGADAPVAPIESRLAGMARLRPVIVRFVDGLPEQIEAIGAALESGDHASLAQLAHKIKGTAAMVGFDPVSEPASTLEDLAKAGTLDGADAAFAELRARAGAIVAPAEPDTAEPAGADTAGTPAVPAREVVGDAGTPATPVAPSAETVAPIESRLAGMARLRPVIVRFVDGLPEQVEAIGAALAEGDHERLAQLAHKVKGTAAMVGFDPLSEPAATLEDLAKAGTLDGADAAFARLRALAGAVVAPDAGPTAGPERADAAHASASGGAP